MTSLLVQKLSSGSDGVKWERGKGRDGKFGDMQCSREDGVKVGRDR